MVEYNLCFGSSKHEQGAVKAGAIQIKKKSKQIAQNKKWQFNIE